MKTKKEFTQELKELSKSDIALKFGFTFSTSTQKFVSECDREGLLSMVYHLMYEVGQGSFLCGVKKVAEKYPTQQSVSYEQQYTDGYFEDQYGRLCHRMKTVATSYEVPSVWSDLIFGAEAYESGQI